MQFQQKKMRVIVLASGGMDSITALYDSTQKHEVIATLSFDYGARHNHMEIPFASEHSAKLGIRHIVINLGFFHDFFESHLLKSGGTIPDGRYEPNTMKKTVVPFRNGIMISIGAGIAESSGATGLVIAAHAGDHALYPDCREDFMNSISDALRIGTYAQIQLFRPFINMTKAQIAALGYALDVDYARTWTCYKGGKKHCGQCGACLERREAFASAGINDPTIYIDRNLDNKNKKNRQ